MKSDDIRPLTLLKNRIPLYHLPISNSWENRKEIDGVITRTNFALETTESERYIYSLFRGVNIECLKDIIKNGVDVTPTNAPIFVSDSEKALEYGGETIALMGFDYDKLEVTYQEVDSSISHKELVRLRDRFNSEELSIDGKKIWFSMLNIDDNRRTTPYEIEFARYLPKNPFDALNQIWVIGDLEENKISDS